MDYHLIHQDSIGIVLDNARQYRALREPDLAISIHIDAIALSDNQDALVVYILALTDQYSHDGTKVKDKKIIQTIAKLDSEFHRHYYTGIFLERKARAWLKNPMSQSFAYEGLIEAIGQYEMAEKIAPSHCSDPILRYNSCLRTIEKERL
ncbi:conserved hypothetical protein [Isorropodon fossajaponicum endosymbiont JTNG4]|nr:conserved hypothetical protein [Isorropodon fossajaponicum endosymbiont JTNG4]